MPRKAKNPENDYLSRLQKHQRNLNDIMRQVGVSPNRKLLAEIISIWMDGNKETRELFADLIRAQYIMGKGIRWKDEEDPPGTPTATQEDNEARRKIASALDDILKV